MSKQPTAEEINPYRDLDGNSVEKKLLGRSIDEVLRMLEDNSIYYQEMFMWMGSIAFNYYFPAALAYLSSKAVIRDADFINCMSGNIIFRLDHDFIEISPSFPHIQTFIDKVLTDWDDYDIDVSIYVDIESKYKDIQTKILTEQGVLGNPLGAP